MAGEDHELKRPTRPAREPDMATFAAALRRLLRHEAHVKVETLAAAAKMSNANVSRYLRGQAFPSWEFVHASVTVGLEQLNRNSDYITVDIRSELRYWQEAWTHAERIQHTPPQANTKPQPPPDNESITPPVDPEDDKDNPEVSGKGWRQVRDAIFATAASIAAAYTGTRLAMPKTRPYTPSSREPAEPSKPAAQPSQDTLPLLQQQVWKPARIRPPSTTNNTETTQSSGPSRRRIWTYEDHLRKHGN